MSESFLTDRILLLVNSCPPMTGREMYKVLSRDDDSLLPGDVASRIWLMAEWGLIKVRTDLKVVRA